MCSLHTADVVKSGALDLLVGRDDGTVELWGLGDAFSSRLEQDMAYRREMNEIYIM